MVYTAGLPIHVLGACSMQQFSQVAFVATFMFIISTHMCSIMAVVCISIIKRRTFLDIIEIISEVDNKLRYTHQEQTNMNRNVMFNIISEIILLTVVPGTLLVYTID
jgi:hypothetical protein